MQLRIVQNFAALAVSVVFAAFGLAGPAQAQDFPTRHMKLIVPYGPGGAADSLGRAIADRLGKALGQPMIVENVPGAGAAVGAEATLRQPADGHTLFLASFASFVSNPLTQKNLPYDVARDFAGVGLLATTPMVMVAHTDLPVKNVRDFVAYAKANPGKLNFGTSGKGSTVHLAAELFKAQTGVEMTHIPYKSSAEVLRALFSGQIQVAFDIVLTSKPHIDAGRLRALAVTDAERSPLLPAVPTVAESGYPEYAANTWFGLAVRKGTPQPSIDKINSELVQVLKEPALQKQFGALALELKPSTPGGLMGLASRERAKWTRIISDQNVQSN